MRVESVNLNEECLEEVVCFELVITVDIYDIVIQ